MATWRAPTSVRQNLPAFLPMVMLGCTHSKWLVSIRTRGSARTTFNPARYSRAFKKGFSVASPIAHRPGQRQHPVRVRMELRTELRHVRPDDPVPVHVERGKSRTGRDQCQYSGGKNRIAIARPSARQRPDRPQHAGRRLRHTDSGGHRGALRSPLVRGRFPLALGDVGVLAKGAACRSCRCDGPRARNPRGHDRTALDPDTELLEQSRRRTGGQNSQGRFRYADNGGDTWGGIRNACRSTTKGY